MFHSEIEIYGWRFVVMLHNKLVYDVLQYYKKKYFHKLFRVKQIIMKKIEIKSDK